jgi:two-component sensor histidine kinase
MPQGFLSRLWERDASTHAEIARLALQAGGMGAWSLDLRDETVRGTGELADFFGLPEGADAHPLGAFFAVIHDEDVDEVRTRLDDAIRSGASLELRYRITVPDRAPRWVGIAARVTRRDSGGRAEIVTGIIWDETESIHREAQLRRLSEEMDHQVKNAFATIRALVNLGTRAETDMAGFAETMRAEVQALADVHDLTSRAAERGAPGVTFGAVLAKALQAWTLEHADLSEEAEAIVLDPRQASALAMILYQLAAAAEGRAEDRPDVSIALQRDAGTIRLVWSERLPGPAPRENPAGFATLLLQQCASTLHGELRFGRQEHGLAVELELPA